MDAVSLLFAVVAQTTTTTTDEVQRIVGDPLPTWQLVGAGLALLVVILAGGAMLARRARR